MFHSFLGIEEPALWRVKAKKGTEECPTAFLEAATEEAACEYKPYPSFPFPEWSSALWEVD